MSPLDSGAPSGSVLRAEGPLRYLSQVLHDRSYERDQFGTETNNYEAKLPFFFFLKLQPVFFAKCSLESDVCFMEHCHFVAMTKGRRMFFDESVATIFVF